MSQKDPQLVQIETLISQGHFLEAFQQLKKTEAETLRTDCKDLKNALLTASMSENNSDKITPDTLYAFTKELFDKQVREFFPLMNEVLRRQPDHQQALALRAQPVVQNYIKRTTQNARIVPQEVDQPNRVPMQSPPPHPSQTSVAPKPESTVLPPESPQQPSTQDVPLTKLEAITSKPEPLITVIQPDPLPPPPKKPSRLKPLIAGVLKGFPVVIGWFVAVISGIAQILTSYLGLSQAAATVVTVVVAAAGIVGTGTLVTNVINRPPSSSVPVEYVGKFDAETTSATYVLNGYAQQHLYFDVIPGQSGTGCCITWKFTDPSGIELFNTEYASRQIILEKDGSYKLEMGVSGDFIGSYAFKLWTVVYDEFTVKAGDTISADTGPYAGDIEIAGDRDTYTFSLNEGQPIYLEARNGVAAGSRDGLVWVLHNPDGVELFNAPFTAQKFVAEKTGDYQLRVSGTNNFTGQYAFQIHDVVYDEFTIKVGDTVSFETANNAGNIELPGDSDSYSFEVAEGQHIYLQTLNGTPFREGSNGLRWALYDPDGTQLILAGYYDQQITTGKTGIYRLQVWATAFFTERYSFKIWDVVPDSFDVEVGDTISFEIGENAGHIELPGDKDSYNFQLTEGQEVNLQTLNGTPFREGSNGLRWALYDPDGTQLFYQTYTTIEFTAQKSGRYRLVVFGTNFFTERYSFSITEQQ